MGLEIGIVGLPNAGKSTLFNALCARRLAETAPRPFTTIDPHEAVVPVPDKNLKKLSDLVRPEKTVPAAVSFIDIAGLVKGAHKGEGLGNQFLAKIREVDSLVHVVRVFSNQDVARQTSTHPVGSEKQILEDIEIVNLELELGGIKKVPTIYVLNVDEDKAGSEGARQLIKKIKKNFRGEVVIVCAKLEEELIDLEKEEGRAYLLELGIRKSGLEKLIRKAYRLLGLITFYTIKGGKEVHAWSLKKGSNALDGAGRVHSDFAKNFIKAEVVNVKTLFEVGSWRTAKEKGKLRVEGKNYKVRDKDVLEFRVGG